MIRNKLYALLLGLVASAGVYGADTKISALPSAAALGGTEDVPAVQSAATVRTTPAALATYVRSVAGANPTASVGLTGVNGVATTFMRSDGAPAIDVSIAPSWTGIHSFAAAAPVTRWSATGAALNTKNTLFNLASNGTFAISSATDAAPTTPLTTLLDGVRTGGAWSTIDLGNGTDNPAVNFLGTGTKTYTGGLVGIGATGGAQGTGTINATGVFINGVAATAGGAIGGATTQVQYNNAGVFAGSADLTWTNASRILELGAGTGGSVIRGGVGTLSIVGGLAGTVGQNVTVGGRSASSGNSAGGTLSLTAGNSAGSGVPGNITMTAGASGGSSTTPGSVTINAGTSSSGGFGGDVLLNGSQAGSGGSAGGQIVLTSGAGNGATSAGGPIILTASNGGATSGTGGAVTIAAGNGVGTNSSGGNLTLTIGTATGSGTKGVLAMTNATTASTVGAAGGASALPATPSGYLSITINGTPFKIPYYAP